jgi:hypothetical protein
MNLIIKSNQLLLDRILSQNNKNGSRIVKFLFLSLVNDRLEYLFRSLFRLQSLELALDQFMDLFQGLALVQPISR